MAEVDEARRRWNTDMANRAAERLSGGVVVKRADVGWAPRKDPALPG